MPLSIPLSATVPFAREPKSTASFTRYFLQHLIISLKTVSTVINLYHLSFSQSANMPILWLI